MTSDDDVAGIRAAIQPYLDGARDGDFAKVHSASHPQARMSGYLQCQRFAVRPEPFFDAVQNAPAPTKSGEPYCAEIVRIDVSNPVAGVVLEEGPYADMQFATFHLLKVDSHRRQVGATTFMHR